MKKHIPWGVAALAAGALVLSGCTPSAPEPTPTAEAMQEFTVNVAALPISETGALWAGIDAGIFADHGLTLNVIPAAGGAQAVPSLLSGDIDFAIGSPVSAIKASLAGEDVRIIGGYSEGNQVGTPDPNSVVAAAGSGITSWKDLEGKNVGTNSPGAHGNLAILEAVRLDGGDPSKVNFVIVQGGFPAMPALLESGELDAAWVPDPFRGIAVKAGGTDIGYPWQAGGLAGLAGLVDITVQKVIDEKPQMVKQWIAAMDDMTAYGIANPDKVNEAIAKNLDIPIAATAGITSATRASTVNRTRLEALIAAGIRYGSAPPFLFWDKSPDLDTLIVDVH